MDIDAVIDERFSKWSARFRQERAAPFLVLGVNPAQGAVIIAVPEGVSRGELTQALSAALALIERGEAEYVGEGHEARGDLHR